jgi:predicted amidohydrolase
MAGATKLTVAVAQIDPRLGDVDTNLALYEEQMRAARGLGADVVVFPELSLSGYFLKDMVSSVAVRLDSAAVGRLKKLSRRRALIAGLVEETDDFRFYNSAVYFQDGEIIHVHRKVYLPTYGLFDEGRYFARGDRIRSFEARFGRSGMLICEDMWHPSSVYIAALDRAVLLYCPSASPIRGISDDEERDNNARYWELLSSVYAQTFSFFLVHANRVGFEDGVGFWGGSEIVDPSGARLAKAKYYEADMIAAEIDMAAARRQRVSSPLLRDEDVDLTINELLRIRGRDAETIAGKAEAAPAPVRRRQVAAKRTSARRKTSGRRAR